MEYRYLGASGLQISALSYGSWITMTDQMTEDDAMACMQIAYEAGVNFFDTSESYGGGQAEQVLGNILRRSGWKRTDVVIATKLFWGGDGPNDKGLSRKHIVEGARASLARLQLDYVDLIYCHRPDLHTPIEETVRAMNWLLDQGLAFYWGTSEWSAGQIMEAHAVARREHLVPPLMEQPLYNMFAREQVEREYARLYETVGLGLITYSPLAGGLLSGKYAEGVPNDSRATLTQFDWLLHDRYHSEIAKQNIEKVKQLTPIATELDCSMAQLALAWCLKNPQVSSAVTGASRPEQVAENMQALDVLSKLDDAAMARIEEILQNKTDPEADFR